MRTYILKRLLLIPFTLWGIITVNFAIIQLAPGGPVDYVLAQYRGMNTDAKSNFTSGGEMLQKSNDSQYTGAQGVPKDLVDTLKKTVWF